MKKLIVPFVVIYCAGLLACVSGGTASGGDPVSPPLVSGKLSGKYPQPLSYETASAYRINAADSLMRNMPQRIESYRSTNIDEYVNQIAVYILQTSANQYECVKKAHDWTILNIRYDTISLLEDNVVTQDYDGVIAKKLGMSEGLANVFKALCDRMEIKCETIRGYGRGYNNSPFDEENPVRNHVWNMVQIDGGWYFVDCTWDAGYLTGGHYIPRYSTEYLFLPPEYFLYSHFPENVSHQLMDEKISFADFSSRPFLRPLFFEAVNNMDFDLQKINYTGEKLEIEFSPAEAYINNIEVYDEQGRKMFENLSFVQKEGRVYRVYFSFPNSGNYMIKVFSKKQDAIRFSLSAEFGIKAAAGNAARYPTQFPSFGPEISIISPLEMPLRRNETYEFKINVENDKHIILITNNKAQKFFLNEDGLYVLNTVIPGNAREIFIGVNNNKNGHYESIARYMIID
jgi:hypothetical protein